jgi:hypothetical protein
VKVDFKFFFNLAIIQRPIYLVIAAISLVVIFFGILLYLVERGQALKNPKTGAFGQFNEPITSLWCVLTSLITIGYGDVIPQTLYGRIVITVSFLFGLTLIHLITVKLAKRLYKLSANEKSAVVFFRTFSVKA